VSPDTWENDVTGKEQVDEQETRDGKIERWGNRQTSCLDECTIPQRIQLLNEYNNLPTNKGLKNGSMETGSSHLSPRG